VSILNFNAENYHQHCDFVSGIDPRLGEVIAAFGYPPLWQRLNKFETLVHFILEQQVSLASALAALNKLKERLGTIEPGGILALTEFQLRECYCSRQKQLYLKNVAAAITSGQLDLEAFPNMEDDAVRKELIKLKGIGNWTADVYLMFVLQRQDIFPIGDLAAVNATRSLYALEPGSALPDIVAISNQWKPYRTIATMILWHYYLSKKLPRKLKKDVAG